MIGESVWQEAEQADREVHHRVPRCLLGIRDRAEARAELDGEGMQLWLDWELEVLRWGVAPDISREGLAAMVEDPAVELRRREHREMHAEDFARWGRRGGRATLRRYGRVVLPAGEEALGKDLGRRTRRDHRGNKRGRS